VQGASRERMKGLSFKVGVFAKALGLFGMVSWVWGCCLVIWERDYSRKLSDLL
jgi:hypothetical protein